MGWSFDLFKIAGIRLRVHVTFALILLWGAYYWSSVADDGARGAVFGVVATLLLFVCVTLHELGHALQARAFGIGTSDITLYPIGGVARLADIPEDPAKEFRIAIAGPLVNVAILVVVSLVAAIAGESAVMTPGELFDELRNPEWRHLLPYLGFANLSLALFNLLPAFPMDGGRILRSLLAMRLEYATATRIAASVGQAMALLFGLYGFATGNFFLIVLAIFVWMGASGESQVTGVRELLGTTRASAAMTRQPWSLSPEFPLQRAVELTLTTAQADFPVLDGDGRVVGMLTLPDLIQALHTQPSARIGDVMQREFARATANERITELQQRLEQSGARAMAVVDEQGMLAGLLTRNDILELLALLNARQQQPAAVRR